ncbi:GntR family transcriptional regulator [Diaphorobacter aerolatus]|uniref:GntR family transcriptional regulator n=1 Tax=Diaphorobacter aerolatus TaxID=1288495 RepID=A0A7H0GP17_9BURK|nr:GntR family transcriptional regulator [Diaphorobacter aerolatus]QNP50033.1 GntR family transcriptional regulator [Diaphorobacter aerolatus]
MSSTTETQNLTDRIVERLRDKLILGEWVPGQRLSEAALCESLDISRSTVREAFRVLTKEGLLSHEPNKGVSVVVPSIAAIIDIYRVRRMIECQALAQGYPMHPALARMREAVSNAVAFREGGDWLGVGTANMSFHKAVVELADSERLNVMFSHLLAELRVAFGLMQDPQFLHAPYVDMNLQILALFESGKPAEAAQALNDYLVHSERLILAAYARRLAEKGIKG